MWTSCAAPKTQYILGSKKYVRLLESIDVVLSNGDEIHIHQGFIYDQSSSPRFVWSIFPPFGDHNIADLIHDYLQFIDYGRSEMGDKEARKFTDFERLKWAKRYNSDSRWNVCDNYIRHFFIRLFGYWHFKRTKIESIKHINSHLK